MSTGLIDVGNYTPTKEAVKFISFIRATGNEDNDSPVAHYQIADVLFSGSHKVVIECLRGMGKSTLIEYLFIYVSALGYWPGFGKVSFVVFLGANQDGNVKQFFANIAGKIENSLFLTELLSVPKCIANEVELVNLDGIITICAGRGMSTNWRGIKSRLGHRPTVLIADDVLPNDVMTSKAVRDTIETNWYSSALPALSPVKSKIIYVGTPLSTEDLLHKVKNSGVYKCIRFPLCSNWPAPKAEYDSIWPDRFSYQFTKDLYKQYESAGKVRNFYTEFMLQLTDESMLLVPQSDIKWFDPTPVLSSKESYSIYIVTDFATSVKKSADFSTIGVVAVSSASDWLLVDGQCKKQSVVESMEDLFDYVKRWNPIAVGIETNGQQGGFLSVLDKMMVDKSTFFAFGRRKGSQENGIRAHKDKLHRFVTGVQPKFSQNKIWLPKLETITKNPNLTGLIVEMVSELENLTMEGGLEALKHDDALDLFNQLSEMEVWEPSDEQPIMTVMHEDGLAYIVEDDFNTYGTSTVF